MLTVEGLESAYGDSRILFGSTSRSPKARW